MDSAKPRSSRSAAPSQSDSSSRTAISSPANGSVSSVSRSSRQSLRAQVQITRGDVALARLQAAQLAR